MRKLLSSLLVLVVLLVVADRVTVHYVDKSVADRMQEDGRLDVRPDVDIRGFPFLTQALRGKYDRTDVQVRDLTRNGVTVSRLDVRITGARIPLSKVGTATDVPVDGLRATAVVTYFELAHRSGLAGLTVAPSGDKVAVTGTIAGVKATAISTVSLKGDRVVVKAQSVTAGGMKLPLGTGLDFSVRIPALPYGLRLDGAMARPDGVHLAASSGPTVLTPQG
ncbi:MAG: DUF2993 domain-containing protein [Mycobacteriales bacterium]